MERKLNQLRELIRRELDGIGLAQGDGSVLDGIYTIEDATRSKQPVLVVSMNAYNTRHCARRIETVVRPSDTPNEIYGKLRAMVGRSYVVNAAVLAELLFRQGRALEEFVLTVDATGGLIKNDKDDWVPNADIEWSDLAAAYLMACQALGTEPKQDHGQSA